MLDESSPSNGDRMMGFAGMERDTVTGLNLAVNRVENPGTGRWTSQDPLGFAAGDANLYRYVGNDSVNIADPSGLIFATWNGGTLAGGPGSESTLLQNLAGRLGVPPASLDKLRASPLWQCVNSAKTPVTVKFYRNIAEFDGRKRGGYTRTYEHDQYGRVILVVVNLDNASSPDALLRAFLHELIHAAVLSGCVLTDKDGNPVENLPPGTLPTDLSPGGENLLKQLVPLVPNLPKELPPQKEDK